MRRPSVNSIRHYYLLDTQPLYGVPSGGGRFGEAPCGGMIATPLLEPDVQISASGSRRGFRLKHAQVAQVRIASKRHGGIAWPDQALGNPWERSESSSAVPVKAKRSAAAHQTRNCQTTAGANERFDAARGILLRAPPECLSRWPSGPPSIPVRPNAVPDLNARPAERLAASAGPACG